MFVLMDIEWVKNAENQLYPTQLAAMRVDEQWNCLDRFYSRIRPRDNSFYHWEHMAYTGGGAMDFLCAQGLYAVLSELRSWLRQEDIICFWHKSGKNMLKSMYHLTFGQTVSQRIVILGRYVFLYLKERGRRSGSAYAICDDFGMQAPGPKHQSEHDAAAIRQALLAIQYPAALLYGPPPDEGGKKAAAVQKPADDAPYQREKESGLFHKTGCAYIPAGADLQGYTTMKSFFKRKMVPCPHCMKQELSAAIRQHNRDIISRMQYQFVYTEHSQVFHRRDCGVVLGTTGQILGSVYYDGCANTGRRPCKLCHPVPGKWRNAAQRKWKERKKKPAAQQTSSDSDRGMTAQERQAYQRYVQARGERLAGERERFASETEKRDFYTLTQPRFAFFAAAGYQNFHRRNCRKLQGMHNITGFSRSKDALRTGHTPCTLCKPTAKLDIACPIPITNQKRKGESVDDLRGLCQEQGYPIHIKRPFFCFSTPVGRWKIDTSTSPYVIYHINLVRTPDNENYYHRQPRLFLSLLDAFLYIHRHDKNLMRGRGGGEGREETDQT